MYVRHGKHGNGPPIFLGFRIRIRVLFLFRRTQQAAPTQASALGAAEVEMTTLSVRPATFADG